MFKRIREWWRRDRPSEASTVRPPAANAAHADLQDPLPENNWFWRRLFVYLATSGLFWLLWIVVERLATTALLRPDVGIPSLETIGKWIIGFGWSLATYYMLGASGEHVVKVFQAAGLFKAGLAHRVTSTTVEPGKTESTTTTTGPATPPAGDPAPPADPQPPTADQRPDRPTEIIE